MMIPEQRIIDILESRRKKATHLFQSEGDYDAQNMWVREYVDQAGANLSVYLNITARDPQPGESGGVHPLYGDIRDPAIESLTKKDFRAIVDHKVSAQKLKKYGIDEEREVVFWFPFSSLQEAGVITPVRFRGLAIGDLVFWDSTWYIAENVHRDHYQGQTDRFFFVGAFCNRYRHDSIDSNGKVER